jgi:uncharacterized protein (TIGR03437 family)
MNKHWGVLKRPALLGLALLSASVPSNAQDVNWDASGNNLLQGSFYFRHVYWGATGARGDLSRRIAVYGSINFDGKGAYTITGSRFDSSDPRIDPVSLSGTYTLSAGGHGFLSNPMAAGTQIHGMAAQGIFVGSSTEAGRNDLFIAARASAQPATAADFNGSYWISHVDFPSSDPALARDSLFQISPNGQTSLGSVSPTGYIGANTTVIRQTAAAASYSLTNGVGTLTFGGALTDQTLVAGAKVLYLSEDRSFVFGGAANGWDMFAGARALSGSASAATRDGLYFFGGARENLGRLSGGIGDLETYYGTFSSGGGTVVAHRRLYALPAAPAYDFTYSRNDSVAASGAIDTGTMRYMIGTGGAIQIGSGIGPLLGLDVAIKVPGVSGTGVFLNPAGVVNAASSTPFTTGISRGGLITLYGSGLAPATQVDATFPTTLRGVQVMINNRAAPIYVVSPTQISAIVPWGTSGDIASVRVVNGGTSSNTVTLRIRRTSPGIFTVPPGGVGVAAALDGNYALITRQNPVAPGGAVQLFVAGLGEVNPAVTDGAPGPADPLSRTANPISVFVGGVEARVIYAGLPPGLTGLYQINFVVPEGVSSGDAYVDVAGPDSYSSLAILPVGGTSRTDVLEKMRRSEPQPAAAVRKRAP